MNFEEKRRHSRIRTPKSRCDFICIDENQKIINENKGWTLDVSESGILLETDIPLDPQQILLLTIPIQDDVAEIKGKVMHCSANGDRKYKVGIQFLEIEWLYAL